MRISDAALIIILAGLSTPCFAQTKFVYAVRIPATSNHKEAIQTGFRLHGTKGIITALHGVADGHRFQAFNDKQDIVENLTIAYADIENDVALLTCSELNSRPPDGLHPATDYAIAPGDRLQAIGHPSGIDLYNKSVEANSTPYKKLARIVSGSVARALENRKSPMLTNTVINIDGDLGPGYSGGPLLNADNRVVGILDGGLQNNLAICWAIPWADVDLRRIDSIDTGIVALRSMPLQGLFVLATTSSSNALDPLIGIWKAYSTGFANSGSSPSLTSVEGRIEIKQNLGGQLVANGSFMFRKRYQHAEQTDSGSIKNAVLKQFTAKRNLDNPLRDASSKRYRVSGVFSQTRHPASSTLPSTRLTIADIFFSDHETFTLKFGDSENNRNYSDRLFFEKDSDDEN